MSNQMENKFRVQFRVTDTTVVFSIEVKLSDHFKRKII